MKRPLVVRPLTRASSEINVTPLVDVVLVLLIIFMVLTPLLEKALEVRVPDVTQLEVQAPTPAQLVVAVAPNGELSINREPVSLEDYVGRLRRALAARVRGDRLVFFIADDKSNYARVVAALDGARQAGAETLGMMTEPMTTLTEAGPEVP